MDPGERKEVMEPGAGPQHSGGAEGPSTAGRVQDERRVDVTAAGPPTDLRSGESRMEGLEDPVSPAAKGLGPLWERRGPWRRNFCDLPAGLGSIPRASAFAAEPRSQGGPAPPELLRRPADAGCSSRRRAAGRREARSPPAGKGARAGGRAQSLRGSPILKMLSAREGK